MRLSKGRGCAVCYDSGYRCRMGIHEIIETNPELQRLIITNASRDELTEYLNRHEVKQLFDDGIDRVREGQTRSGKGIDSRRSDMRIPERGDRVTPIRIGWRIGAASFIISPRSWP